ncbi:LOW QUALITY PROTEIN: uncharacterized protein PAF06_011573 [Gastrophryne carolinensis]
MENQGKQCKSSIVLVESPEKNKCLGRLFEPASPFQINHYQTRPLLRDGNFVNIVWKFNISDWKVSTQYPNCHEHLINMDLGIEQWFSKPLNKKSKRGIMEGIIGGVGAVSGITNSIDINTLRSDLESAGLLGSRGIQTQRSINQILQGMVVKTATVMRPSILHLQEVTMALMTSAQHSQVARACLEVQVEYSTNFKIIAQAFQGGTTPLSIIHSLPSEYQFALNHIDLWVNKWVGCVPGECYATLIPIAGQQQELVSVTVLGIPVSDTQLLYYQFQYEDFAIDVDQTEPEQLDLSACLHFQSKVVCLPNQIKEIYHSCFHNHSLCTSRIEEVKTSFELFTPVEHRKFCFQVMTESEEIKALISSCVYSDVLKRGLYCIAGELVSIDFNGIKINITTILNREIKSFPPKFNISQLDEFPWQEWTVELIKDRGFLKALQTEIKQAEIVFKHEQGVLQSIQHDWSSFSGASWWSKFKKIY